MKLKQYLQQYNLSVSDFARICKVSTTLIYAMLKNKNVSKRSIRIVSTKTKGLVDYQVVDEDNS